MDVNTVYFHKYYNTFKNFIFENYNEMVVQSYVDTPRHQKCTAKQ